MNSYDVRFWQIETRTGKTVTYRVRWVVAGRRFSDSFTTKELAESHRARLRTAARRGEGFDTDSAVTRSLREGRFLILIAGDGIREGVQALTDLVNRNATKAFSFGLIEVAIYKFAKDRFAIQPRVIAETELVTRQITVVNLKEDVSARIIIEDEEADGSEQPTGEGKEHLKKWWSPLFKMKFNDPEQERPFWTGSNNLVLNTPFPGIQIKAASSVDKDYVQIFLSGTRWDNVEAIRRFVKRDKRYLQDNLPEGTIINTREGFPVECKNQNPMSDAEKHVWIGKTLNAFVDVLRPRLRKWHEEIRV